MATKVNHRYVDLLRKFIDHLERRDDGNGWVLISRPSYETTNIHKGSLKSRPKKGMKQMFKVFAEWNEMGDDGLDIEIEYFLKKYLED